MQDALRMRPDGLEQGCRSAWSTSALCASYELLVFSRAGIKRHNGAGARYDQLHWAIGVLLDGQCEVLGVWRTWAGYVAFWPAVFGDLRVRGVEQIRVVVCDEPLEMRDGLHLTYPEAKAMPSAVTLACFRVVATRPAECHALGAHLDRAPKPYGSATAHKRLAEIGGDQSARQVRAVGIAARVYVQQRDPLYALKPRLRRAIRAGVEAAERVAETLRRGVARQRSFPSEAAALEFVSGVLRRVDREFGLAGPLFGRGGQTVHRRGVGAASPVQH